MTISETRTVIFGAGPAGLSIAHTVLSKGNHAIIVERSSIPGGLSRSIEFGGGIVDIGPHVIGMEYPVVTKLFKDTLGDQSHDFQLRTSMLWESHEFSYPPKPLEIVSKLGIQTAIKIACSCVVGRARSLYTPNRNYREMANHKYGRVLTESCIEPYIERLWGLPCDQISVRWKPGRFIRSSLRKWIANAFSKQGDETVTHPNLGMGQFYEELATSVISLGGEIQYEHEITRLEHSESKITSASLKPTNRPSESVTKLDGRDTNFVSTLPLTVLLTLLDPPPPKHIKELGKQIAFRNTLIIYFAADEESSATEHIRYLNEPGFRISRVANYSQWSPGMKSDTKGQSILGCEIWTGFDDLWTADDEVAIAMAQEDLAKLGYKLLDSTKPRVVRVPHSHPVITLQAQDANIQIHEYLSKFSNLTLAGRAGLFEYADQNKILDMSIKTAQHLIDTDHLSSTDQ